MPNTVFFDVDTQLDFLYPAGALYVPGAEQLVASLARLTKFAELKRIPIISTADAHTENDPEFKLYKPHCVAGTAGQRKSAVTLLKSGQFIVEKQKLDCFSNPDLPVLLNSLEAERYVVYGVVTELCVQCAAFGLLRTGAQVELVTDAIQSLNPLKERETIHEFRKRGGTLTTVEQVLTG